MSNTFDHLGLPETMMAALKRMNFTTPTPIQSRCIPLAMEGRDILGSAQTGTGKTGAFCIPMIAKLMEDDKAMALIVTPTRELATQILSVVHTLTANNRNIRTALLIGGDSMGKQFAQLRERPRLIVGTPGRINDHLRRDPRLLASVVFVAIDEADRMLDMGFSVQLDEILKTLPKQRQTLMFSATFPDAIVKFSRSYLNNPERVSVSPDNIAAPKIKHEVKKTNSEKKYVDLLAELEAREGSVIIFVKTQHGTDRLAAKLIQDNHTATPIHGGLRQNQRDRAVKDFRSMRTRVLVATDVASRGLDIPHIEHVINYDMPQVAEDYIHRIGRTARAGAEGNAVAFVMPSDTQMWNAINRLMNPGAPMERVEGPQGNRRGSSGGYKGKGGHADYKKRNGFGGGWDDKKPSYNRDERKASPRSDDRKFPSRDGRPAPAPVSRVDRPERSDRPAQAEGGKPFVKYYVKDGDRQSNTYKRPSDGNWNNKDSRAKYNAADGKFEQPREGRGDGRQDNDRGNDRSSGAERSFAPRSNDRNGNDRSYADRPRTAAPAGDRPRSDKPFYKKDGDRSFSRGDRDGNTKPFYKKDDRAGNFRSERPVGDRPVGDRPTGDRPSGNRNHRFDGKPREVAAFKGSDGPRKTYPDKPRGEKPASRKPDAAKKPFKFKEHSRKTERSARA